MIRLILSDIDGTLLQNGETAIPPEIFAQIPRLAAKGIRFCPASGRQYESLRHLFAPVADDLTYLCENGAVLVDKGKVIGKTVMDFAQSMALCRDILAAEGCEVLISGENMSYTLPKKDDVATLLRRRNHNNVTVLKDLSQVPEEVVKVSIYHAAGTSAIPPFFWEKWKEFNPAVAGEVWLDFTLADKGAGLLGLCDALEIPPGDVMAFGDNFNDLPMLDLAGHPYLMSSAAPSLLPLCPHHCATVVEVLRAL